MNRFFLIAATLANICCVTQVMAEKPNAVVYVEVDYANVGKLLKSAVEDQDEDPIPAWFAGVPDKQKERLYRELGRRSRVVIIERLIRVDADTWKVDDKYAPIAVIKGESGGILDKMTLGTKSDCAYAVSIEVFKPSIDSGVQPMRTAVVGIRMRLVGEALGLELSEQWLAGSDFAWNRLYKVPIKELLDAVTTGKDASQNGR